MTGRRIGGMASANGSPSSIGGPAVVLASLSHPGTEEFPGEITVPDAYQSLVNVRKRVANEHLLAPT
jgi:hypothetical protein